MIYREGLARASRDRETVTSRQILREYLACSPARNLGPSVTMADVLDDIQRYSARFHVLEDGPAVTDALIALCREVPVGGRQIHDANIVATMLACGERRLLTFNTADFRRYGDRIELVSS